jgi:hypothetical protein
MLFIDGIFRFAGDQRKPVNLGFVAKERAHPCSDLAF